MGWRCYGMFSKDETFLIRGALVFPPREYHSNLGRSLPTLERLHTYSLPVFSFLGRK